jgi:uncharacterized protein
MISSPVYVAPAGVFMSHQPVIDGFEFASAGATQQGRMSLGGFARLRDLLASDAGEVAYRIEGTRDARGRAALRLSVQGMLQLRCQRCLEALPFEVREEDLLVLAATQEEIDAEPADPESPDRIVAGRQMAVSELVEDELVLALPYAARHEECRAGARKDTEKAASPFAGLRGLLDNKH